MIHGGYSYSRLSVCGQGGLITRRGSGSVPFTGGVSVDRSTPGHYTVSVGLSVPITEQYNGVDAAAPGCPAMAETHRTGISIGVVSGQGRGDPGSAASLHGTSTSGPGSGCSGAQPGPLFAAFPNDSRTVSITWHLSRPECGPDVLAKALREYETARGFALAGVG